MFIYQVNKIIYVFKFNGIYIILNIQKSNFLKLLSIS